MMFTTNYTSKGSCIWQTPDSMTKNSNLQSHSSSFFQSLYLKDEHIFLVYKKFVLRITEKNIILDFPFSHARGHVHVSFSILVKWSILPSSGILYAYAHME